MAKRGRKEKYESHVQPYLDRIPVWRRQGMTEEQIAHKLGIGLSTIQLYKKENIELLDALREGTAELIEKLEETLYNRAIGIDYEETKTYVELTPDSKGKETKEKKKIERIKKWLAPDVDALKFALKNLHSGKWKEKQVLEHEEVNTLPHDEVERYLSEIRLQQEQKNNTVIDEDDEQEA